MGISIAFWNHGYALSLPVLFVVLQRLYFRHHGIDASAFLRLDWIVDVNSENVSLPERPSRDFDNRQRSETPREKKKAKKNRKKKVK